MGSLLVSLSITSSDATSERLNIGVSDTLSVTNPIESSSSVLVDTATPFNILTAAGNTSITYVYIKNKDATNFVTVSDDAGNDIMDISPNEFAFFPVKGSTGIEVLSDTSDCIIEYGYWTKS